MGSKIVKYFIVLLGTLIWSVTMFRSGLEGSNGIGFWGANGHDGVWHVALIESLARRGFNNPVFSGSVLQNYHLGFDILLAITHRLTGISIGSLYFQLLPIVFSFLIGILTYKFVFNWRRSLSESFWAVFFVYFGSSFGFVITFLRDKVVTGESMFWASQSISTLINPPFALSLIIILLGLIALQNKKLLLSILCFGILIQIKAYAAILVLGGLFIASIFELFTAHRSLLTKVFLGSLLLNLILFFLFKNDGTSVFVWQPFWFLETMMSYSDRLGWDRFYSAMTTYKMGHIWIKGILAYGTAFVIFIIGNMGLRVVGFYFFLKHKKLDTLLVFILTVVLMAIVIPMFFVQKGTPWNTIQFFYYYLFFFSVFAGIAISWSKVIFKLIIIVFAIFGSWATLQHYLPPRPQSKISTDELYALKFLANQDRGIVFTYPFDSNKAKTAENNPPRPLYFYDSTAYVSAYSKKDVFLEDEINLNIMDYDWKTRREESLNFISNLDPQKGSMFLKDNNIKYLYLVKDNSPLSGEYLKLGTGDLNLEKIFENREVILYKYE
ncbi:MAG: hypothetical protein UR39_C0001G0082 [Candidatus Woesebacteria bacterium GW2011_GWA1_33_30]|uniref:Glycosyltransferase RgtA/B/C/D-like domain-containing protein n=1 Tax=Candidatus Woesebacteria bacterium GW2011_GWA2_33_28 TaxID=1618561 RepID=A0A0G0CY26_9BACT|nr:MAG: hypothetical protein UR38_C0001G0083 [Candidatus Woesebacteria bacterium GW2011_GWA2_33_28]KKP49049.1 MAG: hypothetical protein UR39_C0001G0082 [Candidatus Woesebacteria bacterium GW2011_GWA1_33_30]KKP49843.1 MAG: hypothetical protein UR40_C0003G0015 [Microgenomates group bacterium GW2011_GWC1_33_32]KKP52641.1 MAG: hypothetical protein UR44_C0001G0083 [Candidatus Woesebacteria bacterium GW2011_GWB1_33_38]KKP58818.1 MAG: hypothetical protein UR48_C0001G0022 [Microgenomates group bacteriu